MRRIVIFIAMSLLTVLTSYVFAQTLPSATQSLVYPFNETINRCEQCGFFFAEDVEDFYTGCSQVYHPGWDMNHGSPGTADEGGDIYAIADGVVYVVERDVSGNPKTAPFTPVFWNAILIQHNIGGDIFYSAYGHAGSIIVDQGESVTAGQKIGTIGHIGSYDKYGNPVPHLHLEVRDEQHPSVWDNENNRAKTPNEISAPNIRYWQCGTSSSLSNQSWVTSNYYNPELFIKGLPAIGRTNTGLHAQSDKFNSVYLSYQGPKTGANPWDQYQYWDQVIDRGPGDIYVHWWPNQGGVTGDPNQPGDPEAVELQDLYNVQDDKYAALIYNSDPNVNTVFYCEDPILGKWLFDDGYAAWGPPTGPQTVNGNIISQPFAKGTIQFNNGTFQIAAFDENGVAIALVVENEVVIDSDPPAAEIWNGSVLLGNTALKVYLDENQSKTLTAKLSGYYDKTFTVDWNDGDQVVEVTLEPTSTGTGGTGGSLDLMAITPGFLDFGLIDTSLTFTISKETTVNDLAWTATPSQNWITCTPASGTATSVPSTVTVNIDYTSLSGKYEESVSISSTAGTIQVPILLDANSQWPSSPVTYDFSATSQLDDWLLIDGTPDSSGIKNGVLKLENGGIGTTSSWTEAYATAAGAIFDDVSVTFTFDNGASEGSNQTADIRLCYKDKNNYYVWRIKEDNRAGPSRSYTKLVQVSAGGETDLTAEFGSLASGTYTASYLNGVIRLQGNGFDQSVNVGTGLYGRIGFAVNEETTTFDDVSIDGTTANFLLADKTSINFGTELVKQTIQITGLGGENVAWQVSSKPSWLSTHVSSGTAPDSVICTADRSALTTGTHTGDLVLSSGGGSRTIPVSVDVPKLVFSDDFDSGSLALGWTVPIAQWEIVSGEFKYYPVNGYTGQRALVMDLGITNVALEVDWRQTNTIGNRLSFFYLHFSGDHNSYFRVTADKLNNRLEMEKKVNGQTVMMRQESINLPYGRYRISVKNDTLYFAGLDAGSTISLSAYDATLGSPPMGWHGVGLNQETIYVDNVKIYDLDDITPPNTPILVTPASQDIGSASSGTLSDSLLFQSTGTATVVGTITTTGNISMDSSSVTMASGASRKYEVTVNLDALSDGSYSDTVKVSYSGNLATTVVTYTKSAAPSTILGLWYMDGSVGTSAKRTNEETGALLTEVGLTSTTGHTGIADEAYLFNGASYAITDLDSELDGATQLTIAMWVKTTATSYDQLLGRWNVGNRQFAIGWHFNNQISFTYAQDVNDSGGSSNSYAMAPSRDTNWHHIAFVYNGTAAPADRSKIYYDGQALATTIAGTIPTSLTVVNNASQPLVIGNYEQSTSGPPHTGSIDYVQVDNKAWTASEVSSDYTTGLAKRGGNNDEPTYPALPTKFALQQNYPNPFNPSTQIRFDLPQASQVKLTIYNVLGQKVVTLVDEPKPAGQHSVVWNGQDELGQAVSSGIYIYKIQAASFIATRKMLFLK